MRRKRKKRNQGDVELNLAAMLDMAFQLLAFFILTFKPAPVEGQVLLRMPPPQAVTNINSGQKAGSEAENTNPVQGLNTLLISAIAHPDGTLRQMAVGEAPVAGLTALERKLQAIFSEPSGAFDQVIVQVDGKLRYEELMRIIDVCTKQKLPSGEPLTKLSFVESGG